jgi:hypothetical protein
MPLYKDFSDDVATVLVWEYDENEVLNPDELLEPENQNKILGYHPNKIAEVLMVRKMLKEFFRTIRFFIEKTANLIFFLRIIISL